MVTGKHAYLMLRLHFELAFLLYAVGEGLTPGISLRSGWSQPERGSETAAYRSPIRCHQLSMLHLIVTYSMP